MEGGTEKACVGEDRATDVTPMPLLARWAVKNVALHASAATPTPGEATLRTRTHRTGEACLLPGLYRPTPCSPVPALAAQTAPSRVEFWAAVDSTP